MLRSLLKLLFTDVFVPGVETPNRGYDVFSFFFIAYQVLLMSLHGPIHHYTHNCWLFHYAHLALLGVVSPAAICLHLLMFF